MCALSAASHYFPRPRCLATTALLCFHELDFFRLHVLSEVMHASFCACLISLIMILDHSSFSNIIIYTYKFLLNDNISQILIFLLSDMHFFLISCAISCLSHGYLKICLISKYWEFLVIDLINCHYCQRIHL